MIKKKLMALLVIFAGMVMGINLYGTVPAVIGKAGTPPVIDGKLDEALWQEAPGFSEFKTLSPAYGLEPSENTRVYVYNDQNNIYFGIRSQDSTPGRIKASLTKRDDLGTDDWVSIELDTFNNSQTSYMFKVNPLGIQADGMITQDGKEDLSFDTVWYSRGNVRDNGYELEIAIPFKSLRFPDTKKLVIGMGVQRGISRKSEVLSFPRFDPKKGSRLVQRKEIELTGIDRKRIVELMPSMTYNANGNRSAGDWNHNNLKGYSLTAKLGLTSTLVLDATYNPDFSGIESDAGKVDINLRDALFYAEKRPFFLEGQENFKIAGLHAGYLRGLNSVVNTRSIVDPLMGVKVSGQMGTQNSLNAIFAIDEYPKNAAAENGEEGKNSTFTIVRYKRGLKEDGYIGSFFTSKTLAGGYNRVIGSDGRFRLSGRSRFEYFAFASYDRDGTSNEYSKGSALGIEYLYTTGKFDLFVGLRDISRGFRTGMGYQRRSGITRLPIDLRYRFYPKSSFLKRIDALIVSQQTLDKYSNMMYTFNWMALELTMPRQTRIWLGGNIRSEVFANRRFDRKLVSVGGHTQILKRLYLDLALDHGKKVFYDINNPYQGKGTTAELTVKFQPTEKLSTSAGIIYTDFFREADNKKIYDYTILRSRNTFQFNKKLYIRGILEYNSYYKELRGDFLASFTYIPGTVLQAGYGSVYEKVRWNETQNNYMASTNFYETKRSFFLKASYLWRL
ncbi:MAG: carbohydrate binding family 9 domain-containing protein [bacterium]|nr:carbohydrate binding family 9 domain-containing protein [bacterium]